MGEKYFFEIGEKWLVKNQRARHERLKIHLNKMSIKMLIKNVNVDKNINVDKNVDVDKINPKLKGFIMSMSTK